MNLTLIGFIRKELTQSFRDPNMKFILFFAPIIQMFLFGVAISNEVKNIRLAAYYDVHDTVMNNIYIHSLANKWFVPVDTKHEHDPFQLIQSAKADAVLVAPPGGFSRALGRGDAPIQLLIDSTNVIQAQAVENYLKTIINTVVNNELKIDPPKMPVKFDVRILYNPQLETSIFMIPGVMCIIMVFSTLMLTMTAIVREKESGTFEMLISAPLTLSEIIFGKTIPYVIIGLINLPIILSVALFGFHVPMRGSFLALFIAAFAFICTCVAIGALMSTFCKNQQQAALAAFWILFPAIMFSGLLFPLENMPTLIQWLAYCDPLAHYLGLLRNILLKGGGLEYVVTHTGVLIVMALLCTYVSFHRFRTTLQ